jgi:hypothetical protein
VEDEVKVNTTLLEEDPVELGRTEQTRGPAKERVRVETLGEFFVLPACGGGRGMGRGRGPFTEPGIETE